MILVDDRELKSGICAELEKLNVEFKVQRLKVGDYIINEKVFIERKTVPDFIESLKDQRLFKQVVTLRQNYKRTIIIIEGKRLPGGFNIRGVLCSLASRWYTPVLRSIDLKGTAWILKTLMRGVGPDMARKLLKEFGALGGILSAKDEDLMEIDQVGEVVIGQINILRGDGVSYDG